MSDRDLFDFISLAVGVATLLVTGIGLYFVVASLKQSGQQQRIEAGPYVRVDIGALSEEMIDFEKPAFRFRDSTQASELEIEGSDGESVTISAWFRNYQPHSLGMAFGVSALFLIEVPDVDTLVNEVRIAYLEHGKTVLVDIARLPRSKDVTVRLISLSFLDFYDQRHEHEYGAKGTNALHGRLIATFEGGRLTATPEGRSRGHGVDFSEAT